MRDVRPRSATRELLVAASVLSVVILAVYWRLLLGGETFVGMDALVFVLPSRDFLANSLQSGRIPEWSNWVGLGAPFAANPIHGVTYPPLWPVALLPPAFGSDLISVVHLALGAVGLCLFARRLGASLAGCVLAGGTFALSGYVTSVVPAGWAPLVCWMPWIAWAADRLADVDEQHLPKAHFLLPRALALAAFLSLQALLGEPVSLISAVLLGALVTVARPSRPGRALVRFAVSGAIAAALAAVALIPAALLLPWSDRASGVPGRVEPAWVMHPLRLLELAWPSLLGSRRAPALDLGRMFADTSVGVMPSTCWASSVFLGGPVVLLAMLAAVRGGRRERWLLSGAILFILLALGNHTPIYPLLARLIPPIRIGRYPEKYLVGTVVLLSALAGAGSRRMFGPNRGRGSVVATYAMVAVIGVLLVLGIWERQTIVQTFAQTATDLGIDSQRGIALVLESGAVAWGATVLFALIVSLRQLGRTAEMASAAVILLGAALHARSITWTAPRTLFAQPPPILASVKPTPSSPRPRLVHWSGVGDLTADQFESAEYLGGSIQERALMNVPARFGFAVFPGFDSVMSAPLEQILDYPGRPLRPERYLPFFGVDYALAPAGLARDGVPTVARAPGLALVALRPRPRAWVAPRWTWGSQSDALRQVLAELTGEVEPDLGRIRLVGAGYPSPAGRSRDPIYPCDVIQEYPERVELSCDSPVGGYAVLLDAVANGWSAELDGSPTRIETADGLFRAVPIGPGPHKIVFDYRTPGLRLGAIISGASWFVWVAVAAGCAIIRRRQRTS